MKFTTPFWDMKLFIILTLLEIVCLMLSWVLLVSECLDVV